MVAKKKERKLTLRERRFIKYLPESKSISEAMRKAGYAESLIEVRPKSVLGKSQVQSAMQKAYEKQGITTECLAKVAEEGLKANKVISAMVIAPDGEGMKDAHSMTKDFVEVPDFATRHKYLDTAHKLRADYPAEKHEVDVKTDITVKFEVVDE